MLKLNTVFNVSLCLFFSLGLFSKSPPVHGSGPHNQDNLTLGSLLKMAQKENPEIVSAHHRWKGIQSLIPAKTTMGSPMIGVSTLDRGSKTKYFVLNQKIKFPYKYYLEGRIQNNSSGSAKEKYKSTQWRIRQKIISTYFSIYGLQKVIQLKKANIQTVREFSRIAEKKYAAGKSSQADSMKGHFELTQLQLELLRLEQEAESFQENMASLLPSLSKNSKPLDLTALTIDIPAFNLETFNLSEDKMVSFLQEHTPEIKAQAHLFKQAQWKSSLARWDFAPDFQFQYQERISGSPQESRIYSLGITIPLWFWSNSARLSSAKAQEMAQEAQLKNTTLKVNARTQNLKRQIQLLQKTLSIYKSSLIPQATSAYNSTKSAYRASKNSFFDLLDAERSLYKVKIDFYQTLRQFAQQLSQLESQLGVSLSNFEGSL